MGKSGNAAGSDLLKRGDAKTEIIRKGKIVALAGGKGEMRPGLEC